MTAPRVNFGPTTRAHLEMWVLRKDLSRGLEPTEIFRLDVPQDKVLVIEAGRTRWL